MMLRKYACLLLLGWSAVFVQAQPSDKKPIVVKKETRQDFSHEGANKNLVKQVMSEYDRFGKIIQYSEFDVLPKGRASLNRQTIHKYNQNGKKIGMMRYNSDNALLWSEEITLDQSERVIKTTETDYQRQPAQVTYTLIAYDNYGNEALFQTFNQRNEQTSEKKRTYNEEGELITFQQWGMVQNKSKEWVKRIVRTDNEYNKQGHVVKSISDIQEGKLKWREVKLFENCAIVECDKYENGKLVSRYRRQERDTTYNPDYEVIPLPKTGYDDLENRDPLAHIDHTDFRTITLKTDQNGNVSKKIVREMNEVYSVTYYYYDDKNRLIKDRTILKADDSSTEHQYTYDEYGHITKELVLENDQAKQEFLVLYEYYPN
jgi:YD repeat-containing protein